MSQAEKKSRDIYDILAVFRKRIWLLGFFLLGVLVVVMIYNQIAPPLFYTELSIMYEELMQPIPNSEFYQPQQRRETLLSNQIEEIKSRQFFDEVVTKLPDDAKKSFKIPDQISDEASKSGFLSSAIRRNTDIFLPDNNSNVIRISYTHEDPEAAYQVAQTILEAVKRRALAKRKQNISSARQLIEEQLLVFKTQLDSTEKSLRDFKEHNQINSLNQETNELLRQITEAEVLLTSARSNKQGTQQRLEFIQQKIRAEQKDLIPNVVETIGPRLEKLKNKLVDLELQRTDLLMKGYSTQHPKLEKLSEEISQTRESLSNETRELIQKGKFVDPLSQLKDFLQEAITLEANLTAYEAQVSTLNRILDDYNKKIQMLPDLELQLARLIRDLNTNEKIYTMLLEERERTRIVEAQNTGNIRIIDPPALPNSPIRPRKTMNLMVGLMIGFIIGSIMVFVFESFDTSLKTSHDVERLTDLSVLGIIPKIKANVNGNISSIDVEKRPDKDQINQMITLYDGKSRAAEAFRMLRTNLQFSSSDFRSNAVLITSPEPGEGKSTTAINLAITTAQLGYETLLVDADLRRPNLHKVFRIDRDPGLVDILLSDRFQKFMKDHLAQAKKYEWENLLYSNDASTLNSEDRSSEKEPYNFLIPEHRFDFESLSGLYSEISGFVKTDVGIEHLSILTSGGSVSNSSEILGSRIMHTFISLLKKKYDVVYFDCPPVLVVTDTAVLASLVDGVLIVCTAGKTHQRTINRAIDLLEKGKSKIWGVVLNKALEDIIPHSYKKYYAAST
ncbi:MAG TPA: GNVR domain-containing protein [bacterium]